MVDAKLTDSQSGSNLKRRRLSKSSFANSVRSDALRTYRGTDLLTATPSRRATRRRSASMSDVGSTLIMSYEFEFEYENPGST